jgi:hypothetical protein
MTLKKPYKAAVIRLSGENEIHVFVQLRDGTIRDRSIGMTDHENIYQLADSDIGLAWLHVEDGTAPVELEDQLESNPEFKDIFFKLIDVGTVSLFKEKNTKKASIVDVLESGNFETMLSDIFEAEMQLPDPTKHN